MAAAFSLIPELDEIVKNGTPKKRAEAIERISSLFLQGAEHFESQHVELFDDILIGLVPATEIETRINLAERLSTLDNAPPTLVKQLAREDEIRISGPILSKSPLIDEPTLIDIARMKGQSHLAAISERSTLSPSITDVILRRGDRDVVRAVAGNAGAQFSDSGYSGLIKRATDDGMLALTVGQREDMSVEPHLTPDLAHQPLTQQTVGSGRLAHAARAVYQVHAGSLGPERLTQILRFGDIFALRPARRFGHDRHVAYREHRPRLPLMEAGLRQV